MKIRSALEQDVREMMEIFNYEVRNSTASFAIQEKTYEVAGYACLSQYRPHEAYKKTVELSVYVSPDFRKRGVGEALMQEIIRLAREDRNTRTVISVITAENQASIRLHEKLGFSFCGKMHEVGEKFGRMLDIVNYELLV